MTQTQSALLRREHLKISIRFKLRSGQMTGDKPRQLYIRLTVNGKTSSDYGSGVYIRPDKWHVEHQKVTGQSSLSQQINRELQAIEAEHKNLLSELLRLHQAGIVPNLPTVNLVKHHWTKKSTLVPTLLEAFTTYLAYLRGLEGTPEAREKRTLDKWENGKQYLTQYIESQKAQQLTCDLVTPKWAEGFYHALIKRPLGLATAARFVGYLRASIDYLVETNQIGRNPIGGYFPDKGKDKPIYFLESVHLERLWALTPAEPMQKLAKDWLLLMCYTGMDQPDLEQYVADPSRYQEQTEAGPMIVIPRGKTGLIACIPLLDEVAKILSRYPTGIPRISNQVINHWSMAIQGQIDFEHRLTTKICRKTAGALFLRLGFRLEEVSKVLGHSSIQTTMRNYLKVTSSMVKAGMERVQAESSKRANPFLHIHRAG